MMSLSVGSSAYAWVEVVVVPGFAERSQQFYCMVSGNTVLYRCKHETNMEYKKSLKGMMVRTVGDYFNDNISSVIEYS
jgi:hypothetical protein